MYVQHGHGKSDKIVDARKDGAAKGVILSPAHEGPDGLLTAIDQIGAGDALLDPQTYVYSIPGGTARCHEAHGLAFAPMHWSAAPADIEQVVEAVVAATERLGLGRVIAPSCMQRGLSDVWTPLALQMARATLAATDKPVLVSVVLDESALSQWTDVAAWLDVVTTLDALGFYLVIDRHASAPYPGNWEAERLQNLLRLIYSLSELNGYEVLLGYSEFEGLIALAAGVHAHATGWHYGTRRFSHAKWQPSTGGRSPHPRVTSAALFTPLRAAGEADHVLTYPGIIDDPTTRSRLQHDPTSWSLTDSWAQYLRCIGQMSAELTQLTDLSSRADWLEQQLGRASDKLNKLTRHSQVLPPAYATRVTGFRDALEGFRRAERI